MGKVIIPKTYIEKLDAPLIFLLGPITSAPNWQDKAIEILFSQNSDLLIVSPRRGVRDKIAQYILTGDENHFCRQRVWEWHYQGIAAKQGCNMFWFPEEYEHHCDKSYALITSNEFGHWTAEYSRDKSVRVCFGTDGRFREWGAFETDLRIKCPDKKIFSTLEKTCAEAARIACKK